MPLTPEQRRTLACVLDEIIPPSDTGPLPGAGELGLAETIEEQAPDLAPVIAAALPLLDGFEALSKDGRLAALNELATAQPAFLPGLIFQAYVGYYQDPRVIEGLGLEPRPPHPEGYTMESDDPTLLDPVRRRPKLYREP